MLIALLPCLTHYFVVAYIAEPMGNLDFGQFVGSMLGLVMISGSLLSIGMVAASLTKSQIVDYILGALLCFILYWVSIQDHYESISRGVLDMKDIIYFVTIDIVGLVICYETNRIAK